eukprot:CAMPEP_0202875266 /NCGR_PEP_ID=MMETSP1391-20130828/26969_1 /ASSEMBLY_ACC=CAM_ASM_000867 /TAXON_ID=1034604 /ORGANISM="Chlamydomonas leiostraca, Strain SAG 11-49" /LENGTH=234 /DNA_ID=CAMNT_0049556905 /DNA_START=171 /DNA_END=876 /DNA_ORIENTATION=-
MAGLALTIFPIASLGLLFDPSTVATHWIRVGGILFTLIGLQYLATGLGDSLIPSTTPGTAAAAAPSGAPGKAAQAAFSSPAPAGNRAILYARAFYNGTIWSRLFLAAGFGALVALKQSPPGLLLLSLLNVMGAASMYLAISKTDTMLEDVGMNALGGTGGGMKSEMNGGFEGKMTATHWVLSIDMPLSDADTMHAHLCGLLGGRMRCVFGMEGFSCVCADMAQHLSHAVLLPGT